jgi:hypothetical protein
VQQGTCVQHCRIATAMRQPPERACGPHHGRPPLRSRSREAPGFETHRLQIKAALPSRHERPFWCWGGPLPSVFSARNLRRLCSEGTAACRAAARPRGEPSAALLCPSLPLSLFPSFPLSLFPSFPSGRPSVRVRPAVPLEWGGVTALRNARGAGSSSLRMQRADFLASPAVPPLGSPPAFASRRSRARLGAHATRPGAHATRPGAHATRPGARKPRSGARAGSAPATRSEAWPKKKKKHEKEQKTGARETKRSGEAKPSRNARRLLRGAGPRRRRDGPVPSAPPAPRDHPAESQARSGPFKPV